MVSNRVVATEEIPCSEIHSTKRKIAQLTAALTVAYAERAKLMKRMADLGMGQREIGAYLGVSQAAVYNTLTSLKSGSRNNTGATTKGDVTH